MKRGRVETNNFHEVHPGAVLKEELDARGLSAAAFALRLRVPPQRIQEIVAEKRAITPERRCGLGRRSAPAPFSQRFNWKTIRRSLAAGLSILSALSYSAKAADSARVDGLVIEHPQMSPDGRIVAFHFMRGPLPQRGLTSPHGIGLYERQSGELKHVPNPPDKQLGQPSFSDDGKRIVASISGRKSLAWQDIAEIDLVTLSVRQVTQGGRKGRSVGAPVFQPGSNNILYSEEVFGSPTQIKLLNAQNGTEQIQLGKNNEETFLAIFNLNFVGPDKIYFQAISPRDPELRRQLKELGVTQQATVAYQMRFGQRPEVLFPEIERNRPKPYHNSILSLSASRDGQVVVASAFSPIELGPKNADYTYEIFRIENNGQLTPLTALKTMISGVDIADDGSAVAFLTDPQRNRRFDISILDLRKKQVISTGLLEKINRDANFVSP